MKRDARFAGILIAVFLVSSAISSGMLYRGLVREDCGLRQGQARTMVVEDLRDRGLPVRDLTPIRSARQCRFAFSYGGSDAGVRYEVSSDWLRGARMARIDVPGQDRNAVVGGPQAGPRRPGRMPSSKPRPRLVAMKRGGR